MTRSIRLPISLVVGVPLLIISLIWGSFALAQEGAGGGSVSAGGSAELLAPAAPVPGGPGFVSLSALAFNPYTASTQPAYIGQMLYNPGASLVYFEGPLTLPHGATITKFIVYYNDNDASNLTAYLSRGAFDAIYGAVMATVSSSGAATTNRSSETTTIVSPQVDNQSNSYFVEVAMPATSNVRLIGVRVDYTFTTSLPAVLKP